MKTCIIQKNDAEESLIRFTEIGCLFNSENVWLDYFQNIIVTDDADSIQGPAWRINAGQYITTTVRDLHRDKDDVDLRKDSTPIFFDPNRWSLTKEMACYRGMKQEHIFRNYIVMVLKSKQNLLYFDNNETLPKLDSVKDIWVPASGDMAGRIKFQFPESKITIYDINPKQLEYSKWLNSHKIYPTQEQFNEYYKTLGRISVAEKFNPDNKNWAPADAEYRNIDILEQKLQSPTILSNILIYMPVYNKHGFAHVQDWKNQNSTFII